MLLQQTVTKYTKDQICYTSVISYACLGYGNTTTSQRLCIAQNTCNLLNANSSGIIYSANMGALSFYNYAACCYVDNCNNIQIPEPSNTLNGLKCFGCSDLVNVTCNSTVFCTGNQKHCGTFNAIAPSVLCLYLYLYHNLCVFFFSVLNTTVKGCVSENLCGSSIFGNFTCCSGNMCNGSKAWLKLDLSLLLMVPLAIILLHCPNLNIC
ncbi:hypothetical protein NFI96_031837 [Prochilodus magdalenae]|nr:hypothetical protein NFI96_031837 [Prochilodus magdalenae]